MFGIEMTMFRVSEPKATPWDRPARILTSPERAKPHCDNQPTQNIIAANVMGIWGRV
jgi:hypothetical protein